MKNSLLTIFAGMILALAACTGTDKTNRNSDTSAVKGNSGPADSTQAVKSSGAAGSSALSPGSTDTSKTGDTAAAPTADTPVNKSIPR
ncbi:hypothetical protein AB6735_10280 [Mucilaginibacter sp. RCC_168]|uniref:hypothetical protein n=1 Tax=Mucilaginibacter sp. RCC_168 TaxID=3239221 RepID=UPI00352506E4